MRNSFLLPQVRQQSSTELAKRAAPLGNSLIAESRAIEVANALDHQADIAKVQEWLGHSNVSTTRLYDRRKTRPEDSPTFHVKY